MSIYVSAQTLDNSFFTSGDRICFVGNSITNNGLFHNNILLYHTTRFPKQTITMFNCGVSGDVTSGVLKRMDEDILIHKPTVAVIMLGMNDVRRILYGSISPSADTLKLRAQAVDGYKVRMEKIIKLFLDKEIRLILQKPTIYDQTAEIETKNNFGVNDVLKSCADFIGNMSEKYEVPVVDYWAILNKINTKLQAANPAATILSIDRVHPAATGHMVMAYQFLKAEGAPKYVSRIYLDVNETKSNEKSYNCTISKIKKNSGKLRFNVKEKALPFPVVSDQMEAMQLTPFTEELNVELLKISGLLKGIYELQIDNVTIDTLSSEQLKNGVNLSVYSQTPQFQQALKVQKVVREMREKEAYLRGAKFIEYNQYFKDCPDKDDLKLVETYLDSVFTVRYSNPYFKKQLNKYIKNKPFEEENKNKIDALRKESYKLAQPEEHEFTLKFL
jgi:endoglucanase